MRELYQTWSRVRHLPTSGPTGCVSRNDSLSSFKSFSVSVRPSSPYRKENDNQVNLHNAEINETKETKNKTSKRTSIILSNTKNRILRGKTDQRTAHEKMCHFVSQMYSRMQRMIPRCLEGG